MLREMNLKLEYNSETDDILQDFFTPCFSACTTFDLCVDYFGLDNLISMVERFEGFAAGNVRMRIVMGHKFRIRDINMLTKMLAGNYNGKGNNGITLDRIMNMLLQNKIMIRIAVPTDESNNVFNERLGLFGDNYRNMVAFTGALIYAPEIHKEFETVDVFTSWNDPERVARKKRNFQSLWDGTIKAGRVYDFTYAEQHGLLKYSYDWMIND